MANASKLIKPTWELYDITEENPEWELYENYIVEFTDISGIKINYYIRSEDVDMDTLYGESTNTEYLDAISTKLIYEPTEEISMTNPFGIVSEEAIQYAFIPKFTFSRDVSAGYNPKPGDVLTTIWNNRNYEIVDVSEEVHIFNLYKASWALLLKPYRFSEQSVSSKEILKSPDNTYSDPITAYGDNEWYEDESDTIDASVGDDTGQSSGTGVMDDDDFDIDSEIYGSD